MGLAPSVARMRLSLGTGLEWHSAVGCLRMVRVGIPAREAGIWWLHWFPRLERE